MEDLQKQHDKIMRRYRFTRGVLMGRVSHEDGRQEIHTGVNMGGDLQKVVDAMRERLPNFYMRDVFPADDPESALQNMVDKAAKQGINYARYAAVGTRSR